MLGFAGVLAAAPCYGACVKPVAPSCASGAGGFTGLQDFDACRRPMVAYREQTDAYVSCLKQNGGSAEEQQAALDTFEQVRVQFNVRARQTPE